MYCCTPKALYNHVGGVSLQPPPVCSIHLDDATAATGQQHQCAHHTPATGGEEREIEPIKWMRIIRRPVGQWRKFGQDPGVTPLLFYKKCHVIFNDHRESGPQFNISSETVLFDSIVSPSLYWGVRTRGGRKKIDASRFSLRRFWIDSENFRIYCELSF